NRNYDDNRICHYDISDPWNKWHNQRNVTGARNASSNAAFSCHNACYDARPGNVSGYASRTVDSRSTSRARHPDGTGSQYHYNHPTVSCLLNEDYCPGEVTGSVVVVCKSTASAAVGL